MAIAIRTRAEERARLNAWLQGRSDYRGADLQLCVCGLFYDRTDGERCRWCQAHPIDVAAPWHVCPRCRFKAQEATCPYCAS
jgi:hypothetical protein